MDNDPSAKLKKLGKYELIARIGRGGMADVHLARQTGVRGFQKIVVVKVIHDQLAESGEFVDMLLDEARVAAMLKHPNVVDIYDLGEADGTYFIAMEYIAGKALSAILAASTKSGSPLDIYSVAHIVAEAADALAAAHKLKSPTGEPLGLVHRDVTPGNIMITFEGHVKLVDFGVAKSLGRITTTGDGELKGKLGYHSPEQIKNVPIDGRSDIFSLGIVLWETLTVGRLFRTDSAASTLHMILSGERRPPSDFRSGIPSELDQICLRALAINPQDRYQSATEMAHDLREVLGTANYYKGKTIIAQYMHTNFADQIDRVEKLLEMVSTSAQAVVVATEEESELSEPMSVISRRAAGLATIPSMPVSVRTPTDAYSAGLAESEYSEISVVTVDNRIKRSTVVIGGAVVVAILVAGITMGSLLTGSDSPADAVAVGSPTEERFDATIEEHPTDASVSIDIPMQATDAATQRVPPPVRDPNKPRNSAAAREKAERAKRRQQAKTHYKAGMAKYRSSNLIPAKAEFQAALKISPGYAPAYRGLGNVYERIGVNSKAVKYFRKYLRASPRAKDRGRIKARIKKLGG